MNEAQISLAGKIADALKRLIAGKLDSPSTRARRRIHSAAYRRDISIF